MEKVFARNLSTVSHPHSDLIDIVLPLYIFVKGCQPMATQKKLPVSHKTLPNYRPAVASPLDRSPTLFEAAKLDELLVATDFISSKAHHLLHIPTIPCHVTKPLQGTASLTS